MQAWAQRLSYVARRGIEAELSAELELMADYYAGYKYGPYEACKGVWLDEDRTFDCKEKITSWSPRHEMPSRGASTYLVHTDSFSVSFDMHTPQQAAAMASVVTMIFVVLVMIFS